MAVSDGFVVLYFIGESLKCRYAVAPEGYLLVVVGDKLFCNMLDGCRFEGSSVLVSVKVSDITNPPPVPCSVLKSSVKQQMPWCRGHGTSHIF